MPRAVIAFDLDGTLVDSAPDIHAVANKVLAEEGLAPLSLAQARGFVGRGASHFVAQMRAAYGLADGDHDRLLASFMRHYEGAVALTQLYPGVRSALEELLGEGHQLVLCTNKPEAPTRIVLDHFDLAGYFDAVVGGDTLPVRKPDPAPLQEAFARVAAGPSRLFVGDSEVDAETGQAAGVPFVLFTEGYRHSEVEDLPQLARFDRYSALPGLAERLLR